MSKRKYLTLVGFDPVLARYVAIFGAWDRETVEDERDEYKENTDYKRLRIISTGASQAEIDAAIAKLNAG